MKPSGWAEPEKDTHCVPSSRCWIMSCEQQKPRKDFKQENHVLRFSFRKVIVAAVWKMAESKT